MRKSVVVVVLVLAFATAAVGPAAAAEPLRSGTLVNTFYPFAPVLAPGPGPDCRTNADCLPFLLAGCPRTLAGRNPGVHSSIVGVKPIAGSPITRTFSIRAIPRAAEILIFGGVAVQFWSRSCSEVASYGVGWPNSIKDRVEFTIPVDAAWMTVAAMDSPPLEWALR